MRKMRCSARRGWRFGVLVLATGVLALGQSGGADVRASSTVVAPWVTTSGVRFVDGSGQPMQFRGVDVSPAMSSSYAVSLGANLVRLYVDWDLIEPTAPQGGDHVWSQRALATVDAAVRSYQQAGVNVLIDFHQCGWSPYFAAVDGKPWTSCAHGIPSWYYTDGRFPVTAQGLANAEAAFWTTEASRSEAAYESFVSMMVERYGQYPNVVGYEIFNEPHPGALLGNSAATDDILRWQVPIRDTIRSIDTQRTVFFQCRDGGSGIGTADFSVFGSMTHMALDFHDYFNGVPGYGLDPTGDKWYPSWTATHNQVSTDYTGTEAAQQQVLEVPLAKTAAAGIPLFVGEWGARRDDVNAATYQAQMLDLFAKNGVSWARWALARNDIFSLLNKDGTFTPAAIQLMGLTS